MARPEPVSVFKFGVEIDGIIKGWFSECSGLNVEREVFEYKEGGVNGYIHKLPGRSKYSNITLKRGIADNELWDWYHIGLHDGKVQFQNPTILLYSADRSEVKRWNLLRAYPVKWQGPDFKADSNQVAIETLELAHHGIESVNWSDA